MRAAPVLAVLLLGACGDGGIYVQNNLPVATIVSPADGSLVLLGDRVTFRGLAEDRDTPPRGLDISWTSTLDGVLTGATVIEGDTVIFEIDEPLTLGVHEIHFTIRDPRDAEDTAAITLTVQQNQGPQVSFSTPAVDAAVRQGTDVPVTATFVDDFTTAELLTLTWSGLPADLVPPAHPAADGTASFTLPAPEYGDYTISVTATDAGGLLGTGQRSFHVYVDEDADGFASGEFGGEDCDDLDPDQHPGADEFCNGEDDDCDLVVDEDDALDTLAWFGDLDGDGYGNLLDVHYACTQPPDLSDNSGDCDDTFPSVHPGADEYCNNRDDDCDTQIDEVGALDGDTFWEDQDGDGYGDASVYAFACAQPAGFVANDDDCDDTLSIVHPLAPELCDNLDNDCDLAIDEVVSTFWQDGDGDGVGNPFQTTVACAAPLGYVANDDDCDDASPQVYPSAPEYCNTIDDDCDAEIDEASAVDAATWYADADVDGYGDPLSSILGCNAPSGFVANDDDCDATLGSVHPLAGEYCNGRDDDCDGLTDEAGSLDEDTFFADADSDGYGDGGSPVYGCSQPAGSADDALDCDDGLDTVYPGAPEICDNLDNDCDIAIDEVVATFWLDFDGDGFGDIGSPTTACAAPPGYVSNDDDCEDGNPGIYPGALEYCDGNDEDCDNSVDENAVNAPPWYTDTDLDGYGDELSVVYACDGGTLSAVGGDCADDDPTIHPGAIELCDGLDNDCDPLTEDERAVPSEYATIQGAVDAALDGDIVCVDAGTFAGPVNFLGKDVQVIGQGPYTSILDATLGGVIFQNGESASASFSGFSVENGTGGLGGAILVDGADPTISNLILYGNTCTSATLCQGSLVALIDTASTLVEVLIEGNTLAPQGGGVQGGLIWMDGADVTWTDSAVRYNVIDTTSANGPCATTPMGSCIDGAVLAMVDSDPTFLRFDWDGNSVETYTYVHIYPWTPIVGQSVHGGLFLADTSSPTFRWNRFMDHTVESWQVQGGLGWLDDRSHVVLEETIVSSVSVTGVAAWGQSVVEGGLFWADPGTGSGPMWSSLALDQVDVTDVAITTDIARGGLARIYGTTSTAPSAQNYTNTGLTLHNSNIGLITMLSRANSSPTPAGVVLYVTTNSYTGHTRVDLSYSSFSANEGCIGTWASCTPIDEFGNFTSPVGTDGNVAIAPLYTSTSAILSSAWDLHLQASSLLRDAGDPLVLDADGSRSAMGAYGGPDGDLW